MLHVMSLTVVLELFIKKNDFQEYYIIQKEQSSK